MAFQTQTIDLGNLDFNKALAQQRLAMQAPKKKGKQKGFLLDQLSTGGGIGGALGGAALGASVGSVVPVIGTAAGGILGALLGGAGGSAAGQVAENAIVGDKLDSGVANEALIGGATALPLGAAFKLGQAGLKIGTGIGKTAAKDLIEQAGAKVVPGAVKAPITSNLSSRTGKNLEKLSGQMLNSQTQVTGAQARRLNLKPVETLANVNRRTGLTNFDDMAQVSKNITGAGDGSILDVLTREAVGSTNGVALGDLRQTASKLLDDKGTLLTDAQRKDIMRNVKNASTTMFGGSEGSLSTLANPSEALNQANKFRAAAQNIRSRSLTATPEQMDAAKVYDGLAKNIEDALSKSPGVNDSIPDLTKYGQTSLKEMAGEARAAGNKTHADAYMKIAEELKGVKSVADLRKLKKDFVDIGKMDSLTAQADGARQFNAESASSMMKGSPVKGTLAALMNMGVPRAAGKVGAAGRALQEGTAQAAGRSGQALLPLAGREAAGRLLTAPGAPQDTIPANQQLPMDSQFTDTQAPQEEPQLQLADGRVITPSIIQQGMAQALADGNTDAAKQLEAMLGLFDTKSDLSSSTARQVAQSANGEATINQLETLLGNAGGAQGPVIGALRGANPFDTNARAYQQLSQGSVAQIAKALGETGALSNSDITTYRQMLPTLSDTPDVAQLKIAALKQRLAVARQNTLQYGAGAQDQFGVNA